MRGVDIECAPLNTPESMQQPPVCGSVGPQGTAGTMRKPRSQHRRSMTQRKLEAPVSFDFLCVVQARIQLSMGKEAEKGK